MILFIQITIRGISLVSLSLAAFFISLCLGCVPLQETVDDTLNNQTQNNEVAVPQQQENPSTTTEQTNNNDSSILGDMDGDGVVGKSDVDLYTATYQTVFGLSEGDRGFDPNVDIDGDGMITFADLQAFNALVE